VPSADPPRIFVSHSRRDVDGKLFLFTLLNASYSEFRPYFYGDENPEPPHAEKIRTEIGKSAALFVLLSPWMTKSAHTRSWVPYEVGIAAARNLPVVVIEPNESVVNLPVPGATHYLRRSTVAEKLEPFWRIVASTACRLSPSEPAEFGEGFWDNVLAFLATAATMDLDSTGLFHVVTCEAGNCRAKFWVPNSLHQSATHPCPACRREVASMRVRAMGLVDRAEERRVSPGRPVAALPPGDSAD
jgi:hypothetical protein